MENIELKAGGLYVLSAPPGAGKSTILNRSKAYLPQSAVVSSDALRAQLLGTRVDVHGKVHHFSHADREVFEILRKIIEVRAREGLTTIVDATSVDDASRAEYAKIAKEFGVPFEVLILDVDIETAKARNAARSASVPDSVIDKFFSRFEKTSKYPHRVISDNVVLQVTPWTLPHDRIDVIGDVHGLFDELMALLEKAGWSIEKGLPVHSDPDRKLLFLGDLVDRGPQSLEVLRFVRRAVLSGVAFLIPGNHEAKLMRFCSAMKSQGLSFWSSFANAETGLALMKSGDKEAQALTQFLSGLPASYVLHDDRFNVAFCHADQGYFDPLVSPRSDLLYGYSKHQNKVDSDLVYQKHFDEGTNRYVLVRGHITRTSEQNAVFSLERDQAFKGELVLLKLDEFLEKGQHDRIQAFKSSIVTQKCEFDFEEYSKKFELARAMDYLVSQDLANRTEDSRHGLRLYKYAPRVFYDALWNTSEWLMKARGIVLDVAGHIIAHPFDKVFNYHENGTGDDFADSKKVVAVEKMNGFLGIITMHPMKNQLLITTQGSFEGQYVDYIRSLISKEMYAAMIRYLSRHNVTLMFEVIHPDDPHIIQYDPKDQGLWLLGVRDNRQDAMAWTEHEVDAIARELEMRRPKWKVMTFGELKALAATSQLEGFMVREFSREERHLLKFKTPYYLTTKFLGRLSASKLEHLYKSPKSFKQQVDEEFYPLIDMIVTEVSKETMLAAVDVERVAIVRRLVDRLVA